MIKIVQIKLSPTPSQVSSLKKQLEEHRRLYNSCLDLKKSAWEKEKKNLSCFDLIKSEVKKVKNNGCLSNYSALQQTIRRLDKAYKRFFKNGGFPRFKGKDRFNTIEFAKYGDGWKLRGEKIYLQNIGEIKCLHPRFPEKVKSLTVTRRGDDWFINISFEYLGDINNTKNNQYKEIGIDFGLKTFITTSDGKKIESPKELRMRLKELKKIHRRIHKTQKGSSARSKHKRSLAKCHKKITNKRKDFNHKTSRKIVNENKVIVVENLDLKKLATSNILNINRTYNDVAWGQFVSYLTYKAANAGRILIKIDPAYTTQECYSCGKVKAKSLSERLHQCECGCSLDRDVNAAKVILRRGLASLTSA